MPARGKKKRADAETSGSTPPQAVRRCSICGRKLPPGSPAASCPVCLLRIALAPGSAGVVKIIDLGLAKAVNEAHSQTAISIPGAFAAIREYEAASAQV